MKKTMKKKVNESIEWFIDQLMENLEIDRMKAVTIIENYLERHR